MFVEERRKDIFNYLRKHGKATVVFLSQRYSVTKETIRSDLKLLEQNSLIKRCHGGAILADQSIKPVSWQSMGFNISELMQELVNKNRDLLYKDNNHRATGKVCVLGSFIIDIVAVIEHYPREGELLMAKENRFGPGGKGTNQAIAASRSGSQVHLIAKVGCDPFGQYAYNHLINSGIDSFTLYQTPTEPTGSALIYLSQETHGNLTTTYRGANTTITPEEIDAILLYLSDADILLVQGEINFDALLKAVEYAHSLGTKIVFNPAPYSADSEILRQYVDYITPNRIEAQKWSGVEITDISSAKKAAAVIAGPENKAVVITLGEQGVLVYDGKTYHHLPAYPALTVDTMGAGDAFNGAFAAALSKGDTLMKAANYACAYSAAFIEYEGVTNMPTYQEVTNRMSKAKR